jgi:hypothetical protein
MSSLLNSIFSTLILVFTISIIIYIIVKEYQIYSLESKIKKNKIFKKMCTSDNKSHKASLCFADEMIYIFGVNKSNNLLDETITLSISDIAKLASISVLCEDKC